MWGSYEDKFAQARALYTYMFAHPGKKLNFMGNEIGMLREWDEQKGCDWFLRQYPMHSSFEKFFQDLTGIYADNDAFYYGYDLSNFQWINADNAQQNLFTFMRKGSKKDFVIALNFSTNSYVSRIGVPYRAKFNEVLNTQWPQYNGSLAEGTPQSGRSIKVAADNQPFMMEVKVPALGAVIFEVEKPKAA
jgi:1,4-alpha-glucan branching enzyme